MGILRFRDDFYGGAYSFRLDGGRRRVYVRRFEYASFTSEEEARHPFLTLWREVERLASVTEVERAAAEWLEGRRGSSAEIICARRCSMSDSNEVDAERLKQSFNKALNRHGYGFQYSVLRKAWDLSGEASRWLFKAAEFPVEVQGAGTRIDFILGRISDYRYKGGFYLVAECKRANPALSNWCFARAPFVHEDRVYGHGGYDPLIMEYAEIDEQGSVLAYAKQKSKLEHPYHVGVEVRSDAKGEPSGESGRAIEDAATQVSRGMNGLIEFVRKTPHFLEREREAYFLPVIFTTARIWTTDADLAAAQIETGNIDLAGSRFSERQWLAYQYHLSPGLKHAASPAERTGSLTELMDAEYVRTIAVVNASGVGEFLHWSSGLDLRW